MIIKYYTNGHIPKQIVLQLRKQGIDIVRCEDVGKKDAADIVHLEFAVAEKRTVVSGDTDFIALHHEWQQAGKMHCGIVYIASHLQGNIGIVVKELTFLHEAVVAGAATLEDDVYNQVIYIT